jgi:hypothetical protein
MSNLLDRYREAKKTANKLYYELKKEDILKQQAEYYQRNKGRRKKYATEYLSTKHGKTMQALQNIRKRCEDPENKRYHRYGGRGIKNFLTYDDISKLWDRDNASSLQKPSLDRIDVNGNYEFSNCQFIEMRENSRKDFIKKVAQYTKDGVLVKVWDAIQDADRAGFQRPNIIKCCQGERPSHKGFRWSYV